ncbi:MAG: hypothetical protein Q4A41_01025 [Bacillota bacterium]|nr:hypothetical protein [Bacillota bacterium]
MLVFLSACDSAQGKTEPVGTTTNLGATSETTTDRQSEDDKMKKYPVFEHLGFEEEQKINQWLNQGSNSDFVYYDASHDLYYFTDTIPRDVMYLTRIPTGGIYTMDGKTWEVKKISDDVAKSIRVYDGWVYYINASEFCMLYRMKADGSMRERVTDRTVGIYEFVGDQIYFIDFIFPKYFIATGKLSHFSTKHKQLSRMNPDGSGYEIVQEEQYWRLRYIDPYLYAEANDWGKSLSDIWRFDPSDPFRPEHMEPADLHFGRNIRMMRTNEKVQRG